MPYHDGNFRSIGLADMALAIRANRPALQEILMAAHVPLLPLLPENAQ